jgi:hypothetical protein
LYFIIEVQRFKEGNVRVMRVRGSVEFYAEIRSSTELLILVFDVEYLFNGGRWILYSLIVALLGLWAFTVE